MTLIALSIENIQWCYFSHQVMSGTFDVEKIGDNI
jgi:hypothetical protein